MLDPNRLKDYMALVKLYEGENDYILQLRARMKTSQGFRPTPKQIEYIQQNYKKIPISVNKEITISSYFATKLQEEHLLVFAPRKIIVVKILANMKDTLHAMVKFTDEQQLPTMLWLPKKYIVKEKTKNVVGHVDYFKFSDRPPMDHQKEAINKLL